MECGDGGGGVWDDWGEVDDFGDGVCDDCGEFGDFGDVCDGCCKFDPTLVMVFVMNLMIVVIVFVMTVVNLIRL